MFTGVYTEYTARRYDSKASGEAARATRGSSGLSLKQVASEMGCSIVYLSQLERGRKPWSEALVDRYCVAIGRAISRKEGDKCG